MDKLLPDDYQTICLKVNVQFCVRFNPRLSLGIVFYHLNIITPEERGLIRGVG